MRLLKAHASKSVYLHWLHLFGFSMVFLQSGGCNGPQDWLRPGEVWPLPRLGQGMGQRRLRPLREAKGQGSPNVERPGVRGRPMRGGDGRPPMGAGSEGKYYWERSEATGSQEAGSPRRLICYCTCNPQSQLPA